MDIRRVSLCLFVILILCSYTEQKRRRKQSVQRKFNELCRKQKRSRLPGTALELQAYFDLRPKRKPFACLKVTVCGGQRPLCFVTTHPHLKSKSINDTSTWQELITFIQRDREIEPIYDTSMSGWNGDKALAYYAKNQPTVHRMCKNANVYRFVVPGNVTNVTNASANISANSSSSQQNVSLNQALPVTRNTVKTLCPLFKEKTRSSRRNKEKPLQTRDVDASKNTTRDNFFLCEGFNCPCVRICLGQGKDKRRFSDCSKFRIICTFNCVSDTVVPVNSSIKPTRRPTKRPTKRPRKHGRSRKRFKKKSRASKTKKRVNRNKKKRIPGNTT